MVNYHLLLYLHVSHDTERLTAARIETVTLSSPADLLLIVGRKMQDSDIDTELYQAFRVFNQDNSGTISSDELRYAMNCIGEKLSDEEIDAVIREADLNGDGKIDCA
jgi:Ca2+-binding EF-hand superfamily protein